MPIARRLKELLATDLRIDVWDEGTIFGLSEATLESLEAAVLKYQFALFVFTPDDQLQSRGQTKTVARDNVLFELGLFVGKLTRRRAFVIRPAASTISLPTDLAGITTATYDSGEHDAAGVPRMDTACAAILRAVRVAITSR